MQLGRNEICEIVKRENPEYSIEFLLDLDRFIFSTLRAKTLNPTQLIFDMSPVGNFTYKKKDTISYLRGCNGNQDDFTAKLEKIIELYKVYSNDKLESKYERFGKESHDAYVLAKKQKEIQKREEANNKQHQKLLRSRI